MTYTMKTKGNKTIIFSRPYLNDQKELQFLDCNEFLRYPNTQFIVSEEKQAIELRNPKSKKKVFLLLKGNEHLLKEASKQKEDILGLLKMYTKSLKDGTEEVLIIKTNDDHSPFCFTTKTIALHGEKSSKFVAGFLYFVNLQLKQQGKGIQVDSFEDMQKHLGLQLKNYGMKYLKESTKGEQDVFTISFKDLMKILK